MKKKTGGAHGRLEPLVGRLRRLADCDARAGEPLGKCMREAATEIEELSAQVRSLQSALDFWLPGVPDEESPRQSVIADHAWLLCGFDGAQASAEKLGWIMLPPNNGLCDVIEAMQSRSRRQDRDPDIAYELRIAGPDDVIVFSDEVEALYRANDVNIEYLADRMKNPNDEVMCIATVHRVPATGDKP